MMKNPFLRHSFIYSSGVIAASVSMRIVYYISIILGIIALCLSALRADWTWTVISAIGLIVFLLPAELSRDFGQAYHEKIVVLFPLPYAAYIMLSAVDISGYVHNFEFYAYIIQTFASMVCGMMLMIAISASTEVKISKRWILLFCIAFACAFSILCTFMTYFGMIEGGWPIYNDDFIGSDNTQSNRHLMLPLFVTTFVSLLYGYFFRCLFKRIPKDEVGQYYKVA